MSPDTAATLVACARQYCEHGKTIGPELRADLEIISGNSEIPRTTRIEARAILRQVVGS